MSQNTTAIITSSVFCLHLHLGPRFVESEDYGLEKLPDEENDRDEEAGTAHHAEDSFDQVQLVLADEIVTRLLSTVICSERNSSSNTYLQLTRLLHSR